MQQQNESQILQSYTFTILIVLIELYFLMRGYFSWGTFNASFVAAKNLESVLVLYGGTVFHSISFGYYQKGSHEYWCEALEE